MQVWDGVVGFIYSCESWTFLLYSWAEGRRFLKDQKITKDEKNNSEFKTKYYIMGGSGILILCCGFLCPCFHTRKKDTAHTVLKDPSSSKFSI